MADDRTPLRLPPNGQGRIYAGRGQGDVCELCEKMIDSSDIEYELEWQEGAETRRSRLHRACYEKLVPT
jgi:hypothetical protein